jgi:hypothetical protein
LCTTLDFHALSVAVEGPGNRRMLHFLTPTRNDDTLLPTLFQNSGRFRMPQEFLPAVFPERFPSLRMEQYLSLVARRATRDYHAGAITRLGNDGRTTYGFSITTEIDVPEELLSVEETREVFGRLSAAFALEPLVYLPATQAAREAAVDWVEPGFPILTAGGEKPPPPVVADPTFTLEIPPDTMACGVFALGREPSLEYERKSQLRFRAGTYALPSAADSFEVELIEELLVGPQQEPAATRDAGTFSVFRIPLNNEVTVYRYEYRQTFGLPSGETLEITLAAPLQFRARGEQLLDSHAVFDEAFFTAPEAREAWQATQDGAPWTRYGSCSYSALPAFEIRVVLEGGAAFSLEERFEEIEEDTGPAALVGAEVTLDGMTQRIREYSRLVYSARRHNTDRRYWVVLEPPLEVAGLEPPVRVIEAVHPQDAPTPIAARVRYLDTDLQELATPVVASWTRTQRDTRSPRFRRGDAVGDGVFNLTDAIFTLDYLFRRGAKPPCRQAADANDDGRINVLDPVTLVGLLFGGVDSLPEPFSACGSDTTADELGCQTPPTCE